MFHYKLGDWFNSNFMSKIFHGPDLLKKWVRQSGNSTDRENTGPFPKDQTHFSFTYTVIMVIFKTWFWGNRNGIIARERHPG